MKLHEAFTPSAILSETHFPFLGEVGVFPPAAERIAEEGFFRNVEIGDVADGGDRRRIGEIIRDGGLSLSYWLTLPLAVEQLNLSSTDESLRTKSVERVTALMEHAAECGAKRLGLTSGPDPGGDLRAPATEQLYRSFGELCPAADRSGGMDVMLEPLDRQAHKNALLGPMPESVDFIGRIRRDHSNIGICWDAAHMALCGEDLGESLTMARDIIFQIHLSNAVLDRADPAFGDNHMQIGRPGFLTLDGISQLLRQGTRIGLFGNNGGVRVAVEVRTAEGGDPWATAAQCADLLRQGWEYAQKEGAGDGDL